MLGSPVFRYNSFSSVQISLGGAIKRHGISCNSYADDMHLYISLSPDALSDCNLHINSWIAATFGKQSLWEMYVFNQSPPGFQLFLSRASAEVLMHAVISCRLDYFNTLI